MARSSGAHSSVFGLPRPSDSRLTGYRARSSVRAMTNLNYTMLYTYGTMDALLIYQHIPELVKVVIWEASILNHCIIRNDTNYLETEYELSSGAWQTGTKGCIQKTGFEEGIPIWKSFAFHFWGGAVSALGSQWTLSPEDYGKWGDGHGNHYLGEWVPITRPQSPLLMLGDGQDIRLRRHALSSPFNSNATTEALFSPK